VVQRRELEFAAAAMPHNSAARVATTAEDVLSLVQLNWQGRVLLADGDVEGLVPGLDVYLTPGHTAGTMTVCLDTPKQRVCYSSDAVYTYRLSSNPNALVVQPQDTWVLDPIPGKPGGTPPDQARITLTTCAELFHSSDRMIAFGRLVDTERKRA